MAKEMCARTHTHTHTHTPRPDSWSDYCFENFKTKPVIYSLSSTTRSHLLPLLLPLLLLRGDLKWYNYSFILLDTFLTFRHSETETQTDIHTNTD